MKPSDPHSPMPHPNAHTFIVFTEQKCPHVHPHPHKFLKIGQQRAEADNKIRQSGKLLDMLWDGGSLAVHVRPGGALLMGK